MAEELNEISALIGEFNTKVKDIEERHDLLTEKVNLMVQSFLKQQEREGRDQAMMRDEIKELRFEVDRLNENIRHIIQDSAEFARRNELKVLEKYIKLWEPLKFLKEEEVKSIVDEKIKKASKGK